MRDLQVAAISLAAPAFLLFMAVGTVFGIGGAATESLIVNISRQRLIYIPAMVLYKKVKTNEEIKKQAGRFNVSSEIVSEPYRTARLWAGGSGHT